MVVVVERYREKTALPFDDRIPRERRGRFDRGKKAVAFHELKHAIAGMGEGLKIEEISVNPTGEYLGVTVFSGHYSVESFQVAAMASSIDTHLSKARGTGSDLGKAYSLEKVYGISASEAKRKAEKHLRSWSDAELDLVAEYIAILGEVKGSQLPLLRIRARMELGFMEESGKTYIPEEIKDEKQNTDFRRQTRIEYLDNNTIRIIHLINDEPLRSWTLCKECGETNAHKQSCKNFSKEDNTSFPKVESRVIFEASTIHVVDLDSTSWN